MPRRTDLKSSREKYVTSLATSLIRANDNNNDNDLANFEIIKFARLSEIYHFVNNQGNNNNKLLLQNVDIRSRRSTRSQKSKTSNIYYSIAGERDDYSKINKQDDYVYLSKFKFKFTTNQINTSKLYVYIIIVLIILSVEVSNVDINKSLTLKEA